MSETEKKIEESPAMILLYTRQAKSGRCFEHYTSRHDA